MPTTLNLQTQTITAGWDSFLDGIANHKDREGDFVDQHAVNVLDYDFNAAVNDETFLNHNCIYGMDPN